MSGDIYCGPTHGTEYRVVRTSPGGHVTIQAKGQAPETWTEDGLRRNGYTYVPAARGAA